MSDPAEWLAEYKDPDDERLCFRIGRAGDDLVAEWIGIARLHVARDGQNVRFTPSSNAPAREVNKIRNGSAAMLARQARGLLAFHGSAVAFEGSAVLFLGHSGAGKSTIAAAVCATLEAELLADDAVPVSSNKPHEWCVEPLEKIHFIDAAAARALGHDVGDAEREKLALSAVRPAKDARPLRAIVDLKFDDGLFEPRIRTLRGIEALASLVPHVIRLVIDEPKRLMNEVEMLARLAQGVAVVSLERPKQLAHLRSTALLLDSLMRTKVHDRTFTER